MKKRLLSVILTLCMVMTLMPTTAFAATGYGIWVGTTEVTSDNASNVLGDSGTPTVTYDADPNTLTLNNANITSARQSLSGGSWTCGIFKESGDLNIVLHGANTIGFGADSDFSVAGIYTGGKLSITGTAADSLSVTNTFTTLGESFGIRGNTGVTIDGCTVTATAGSSTSDPNTVGIYVNTGSLSIKNAVVTGTGGSTQGESFGIGTDQSSLSIENSTVTANGGDGTRGSYGLFAGRTATISNSTVTATGNSFALLFFQTPTVTGLTATASTDKTGFGATAVTLDANVYGPSNSYKYVKITPPPAQWGLAGSGGAAPASWVNGGTLAEAMTYANGLASGTAYIQLLSNVDINAALNFASGKTSILDLNGRNINRGLTSVASNGNVITLSGALTLKDSSTSVVANQGKITGGYSSDSTGGGVYVALNGSFTMTGGNITGNRNTASGTGGGGVYVVSNGSFMMKGGSIADNEALNWGGGVYAHGSFAMLGGSITGNKSLNGGVYFSSSAFTVGGTAVIDDNLVSSSVVERNVVRYGYPILVHSGTPLTTGASIGVTANSAPTSGSPVNVTGTNPNDYSSYFHSDNSSYMIQNGANNVVRLAVPVPVPIIGMLAISDSFTAGHSLTLSKLTSYKPTITDNGVAITAQGWQNSVGSGSWGDWSVGELPLDTSAVYKLRYYATYSGGTVYSNTVTLSVVGNATTLALAASPASPQSAGTPVTLTATLTGFFTGPGVNGQAITFKSNGTILGTANLNASGVAVFTWTPGSTGTYALTAGYAATSYNTAAASVAVDYIVEPSAPVDALNLTGLITAPVKNAAPQSSITGPHFNGTITWSSAPAKFLGGTAYTATVILTAENGYTFNGVAANSFTYMGATSVTNSENSGVITIVFPATGAKTASSVSVSGTPAKTSYYAGDTFDTTGLTITVTYDDGTSAAVTSGFGITPATLTAGTASVTISYGGKSVTVSGITVTARSTGEGSTDPAESAPSAATIYNDPSQPKATIWLSGSGLFAGELLLTPALTNGVDYNSFIKLADKADIVNTYNISLKSGKKPVKKDMRLTFDLGAQYAGQTFTLVHKKADGTFEYFFATADTRGLVSFGPLSELSPFMLVKGKMLYTSLGETVKVPQTGDSGLPIGLALLSLSMLLSALWFIRQSKFKRT